MKTSPPDLPTAGWKATLDYLYARLPMYQRVGAIAYKKDLTNTLALLDALGNPHRQFKVIHVAGTNGKGSVTHMLAAAFLHAGKRTGIYTSPHYRDFRERIKVGRHYIPRKAVMRFVAENQGLIESVQPSFFELTVAMAFWYFAQAQVEVAIIETGLGGRLDSTNVVLPELAVITNIGWDHMDMLGHSLPEIAAEKAGIIKPGVPVVIGEALPETRPVFEQHARAARAALTYAEEAYQVTRQVISGKHLHLALAGPKGGRLAVETDLGGPFQAKNIVTYLAARAVLQERGLLPVQADAPELAAVRSQTAYMGRWQWLSDAPPILADSAHNRDGLQLLFQALNQADYQRLHIVLGVVQDKDLQKVWDCFPKSARYYFAKANVPRGMPAEELQHLAGEAGLQGRAYVSVRAALKAARRAWRDGELILVCGSIFVLAEVLPAPEKP